MLQYSRHGLMQLKGEGKHFAQRKKLVERFAQSAVSVGWLQRTLSPMRGEGGGTGPRVGLPGSIGRTVGAILLGFSVAFPLELWRAGQAGREALSLL